jgi:hypothetical protein
MRSQLPRTIRASLPAFIVFYTLSHSARGDWTIAASASASHDGNVGNAQRHADIVADSSASATLSLINLIPLGESFSLAAGGDASGRIYDHLSGLNDASLDAVLGLKRKWGVGAFAPWTRIGISVGRADYDDGYRDATIYRASIEAGKRLDERWNVWTKYSFERRAANPLASDVYGISGDVFTITGSSLQAGLEYAATERISFNLSSLLRQGDVVSTGQGYADIYLNAKAVALDPTFGAGAYAYRLYGTTYGARLGAEFSLNAHSLIGAGFERLQTHAQGGNNYADSLAEITWNYRL